MICRTCYDSLQANKMSKFALANGTWIGHIPDSLPKVTTIEKALIARYWCRAMLKKLRYVNKGGIGQHALEVNLVSFV